VSSLSRSAVIGPGGHRTGEPRAARHARPAIGDAHTEAPVTGGCCASSLQMPVGNDA